MKRCPKCDAASKVYDSRHSDAIGVVSTWRRRECPSCRHRWTTYEVSADTLARLIRRGNATDEFSALRREMNSTAEPRR